MLGLGSGRTVIVPGILVLRVAGPSFVSRAIFTPRACWGPCVDCAACQFSVREWPWCTGVAGGRTPGMGALALGFGESPREMEVLC